MLKQWLIDSEFWTHVVQRLYFCNIPPPSLWEVWGSIAKQSRVQSLDQGQALLRSGAVSPFSTMHLLCVLWDQFKLDRIRLHHLSFNIIFVWITIENVSEMKFIWLYFYLRWSPMNVSSITAFFIIPGWITFDFLKYERRWSYWRAEPISNDRPIIPELNLALRLWTRFTLEVKASSSSSRAPPACTWHPCKYYP